VALVEGMLSVELAEGMLSVGLTKDEDGWLWRNGVTGNMMEVQFGYFGKLGLENAEGMMENIVGGCRTHCMVWLTSRVVDWFKGCAESCSIFFFVSR
jgi:hypothetical protein